MSEHPGREYVDAAFGLQEERRLRYVEEVKKSRRFVNVGGRSTGGEVSSSGRSARLPS